MIFNLEYYHIQITHTKIHTTFTHVLAYKLTNGQNYKLLGYTNFVLSLFSHCCFVWEPQNADSIVDTEPVDHPVLESTVPPFKLPPLSLQALQVLLLSIKDLSSYPWLSQIARMISWTETTQFVTSWYSLSLTLLFLLSSGKHPHRMHYMSPSGISSVGHLTCHPISCHLSAFLVLQTLSLPVPVRIALSHQSHLGLVKQLVFSPHCHSWYL